MFLRETRKIDYNRTKEGDRAEDRKIKLYNTQRDILYCSYIISNTVGKALTQERGGGAAGLQPPSKSKLKGTYSIDWRMQTFDVVYP